MALWEVCPSTEPDMESVSGQSFRMNSCRIWMFRSCRLKINVNHLCVRGNIWLSPFVFTAAVSSSLPVPAHTESTRHHLTQPGPGAPPVLFSRNQEPTRTHRPASSYSPFLRMDSDLQPSGGPPGPDPQQNPESESLSSLLDEIVFLNQTTVTKAAAVQKPEKLSIQAPGGAAAQTRTPRSRLKKLNSVDPGPIDLTESGNEAEQPGPDSVNTNCGVLAPPPLLHMKMGGAKVGSLTRVDSTGVEGVGSVGGSGSVGWRPMPRLVPLGVQGTSPSWL